MSLFKSDKASHWYTRKGDAVHEVDKSSSGDGTRPTNVSDARKLDLLPSVTNILGVLDKPQLNEWKQEQAVLASLTLPRLPGESLDDFAKRVVKDAQEHSKQAADIGTKIHKACEDYIKTGSQDDPEMTKYVDALISWMEDYGVTIVESEKRIVGPDYAGTADILAMIDGERVLIDIKSQDVKVKELKRGIEPAPVFYEDWSYQLEAYAMASDHRQDKIGNLIIDRRKPSQFYYKIWTPDERTAAWEAFKAAKIIWKIKKRYDPMEKIECQTI